MKKMCCFLICVSIILISACGREPVGKEEIQQMQEQSLRLIYSRTYSTDWDVYKKEYDSDKSVYRFYFSNLSGDDIIISYSLPIEGIMQSKIEKWAVQLPAAK